MKIDTQQLVKVIEFWRDVAVKGDLRDRRILGDIDVKTKEIVDIVGVRRGGKSSILKLIIKRLGLRDNFLYINFEDPFFVDNNHASVIDELINVYKEYFSGNLQYLFFDEIQAVERWEKAIGKLREGSKFKIYLTGSSSKLLSGELSSLLTGRHLSYKLMPLSFNEYLNFAGLELKGRKDIVLKSAALLKRFGEYLSTGGFPEIVLTGSMELLKQYFFDIIQKDIVMRHSIREAGALEKMALFLMTNAAKTISIESLKKTFNISFKMASTYIDYFKESFLIFELPQFSYSLKKQQKALKKYYVVDCGLANATAMRFSEDRGRVLENCVYLHLQQNYGKLFYYKTKNNLEVDFLVKTGLRNEAVIQVAWSVKDEKTRGREVRALAAAMGELGLKQGFILTYDEEDEIGVGDKIIFVKPVYKWLLSERI